MTYLEEKVLEKALAVLGPKAYIESYNFEDGLSEGPVRVAGVLDTSSWPVKKVPRVTGRDWRLVLRMLEELKPKEKT